MSEQDRLEKLKGDVHIPSGVMLKRIGTYLKPEWWRFTLASLFILVNVALDIVLPLIVSWITSDLKADVINLNYVIGLAVSYVAIGVFNQAFLYWESMLLQKAGQNIIYTLRNEVFEHIEKLSQS